MVMQIMLVVVVVVPSAYCASFSQWGLQSFDTKNLAVILITLLVLNFTILGETIICWVSKSKYEKKGIKFRDSHVLRFILFVKNSEAFKIAITKRNSTMRERKNTSLFKRSHIDEK